MTEQDAQCPPRRPPVASLHTQGSCTPTHVYTQTTDRHEREVTSEACVWDGGVWGVGSGGGQEWL